ncbi:FHA domain-containing protein [Butyrivibrio sp. MB2005]|uniref:FHA domain-containing protein n=1 Tax=Butyrivibrio sp. MB2005 TaxID=1280678 RepID=UPI00068641FE|nr:FHA domain-containing protein [Butyrivibrio sp. MB2005]
MELQGLSGIHQGRRIPVNGSVVIGRNQQSCTIVYPDNTKGISRVHCKVDQTPQGCMVTDLGSSYGTFVNGRKLMPNVPTPVREGDTFYLGNQSNSFSIVGGGAVAGSAPAGNTAKKGTNKTLIAIIAAVAAVLVIGIIAAVVISNKDAYPTLVGTTWKVAEYPGVRMSFAENGDLIITNQGEFEINGAFTYSAVGEHMVSVKYTAPLEDTTITADVSASLFSMIGGGMSSAESVQNAYQAGYVWKYEYYKKSDSMKISDVNGYRLFTLEH